MGDVSIVVWGNSNIMIDTVKSVAQFIDLVAQRIDRNRLCLVNYKSEDLKRLQNSIQDVVF
jgi:hypothetical protein